jgi:hypothetical protein
MQYFCFWLRDQKPSNYRESCLASDRYMYGRRITERASPPPLLIFVSLVFLIHLVMCFHSRFMFILSYMLGHNQKMDTKERRVITCLPIPAIKSSRQTHFNGTIMWFFALNHLVASSFYLYTLMDRSINLNKLGQAPIMIFFLLIKCHIFFLFCFS